MGVEGVVLDGASEADCTAGGDSAPAAGGLSACS